jgi:hypothetical protein
MADVDTQEQPSTGAQVRRVPFKVVLPDSGETTEDDDDDPQVH